MNNQSEIPVDLTRDHVGPLDHPEDLRLMKYRPLSQRAPGQKYLGTAQHHLSNSNDSNDSNDFIWDSWEFSYILRRIAQQLLGSCWI